jgi:hypothetical protein
VESVKFVAIGLPSCFDFHHFNSYTKEFSISQKVTNFEAIKAELDKCSLLCCRCHREVHGGMHPGYLYLDEDSTGWGEEQIDSNHLMEDL